MMISNEEWAVRLAAPAFNTLQGMLDHHFQSIVAKIKVDAMLEAAKIASEYHTFGGVRLGLLQRAKELQEGGR